MPQTWAQVGDVVQGPPLIETRFNSLCRQDRGGAGRQDRAAIRCRWWNCSPAASAAWAGSRRLASDPAASDQRRRSVPLQACTMRWARAAQDVRDSDGALAAMGRQGAQIIGLPGGRMESAGGVPHKDWWPPQSRVAAIMAGGKVQPHPRSPAIQIGPGCFNGLIRDRGQYSLYPPARWSGVGGNGRTDNPPAPPFHPAIKTRKHRSPENFGE